MQTKSKFQGQDDPSPKANGGKFKLMFNEK